MPETIGLLLLGSITGIGGLGTLAGSTIFGISLGTIVGTAVIAGAAIGLQYLLRPEAQGQTQPQLPKQANGSIALRQPIPIGVGAYGRVRLGGSYMLYEEKDGTSYDVLAIVLGRISEFQAIYLNEDLVQIDESGNIQSFDDGRYSGDKLVWQGRFGEDTETPYSTIVSALSSSDIWTNSHRGDGIASYSLVCSGAEQEEFQTIYPRQLPTPSVVVDAYLIWDPRDGTQSQDDPSTWETSTNPVLQLIDYLTHPVHGMGLDYDTIIGPVIDDWMEEADLCDELVDTSDGDQKRYISSGWYTLDTKPQDVIGSILATCDGWMDEAGDGTLALKVGVYRAPDDDRLTITEQHILGLEVSYGEADEDRVNELQISIISPDHKYKEIQLSPWRDEFDITLTGRVRPRNLSLQWCQAWQQARRLAKRAMHREKPSMRGSIETTLYGLAILGKRWVRIQYDGVSGLSDAIVEIQGNGSTDLVNGRMTFNWVKIDPDVIDAWDPDTEEGDPPPQPEEIVSDPLAPPTTVFANIIDDVLGIGFDDDDFGDTFKARWRIDGEVGWTTTGNLPKFDITPGVTCGVNAGSMPSGETIECQIARVGSLGSLSEWVPSTPLTVVP
jgi:hypothetical protein